MARLTEFTNVTLIALLAASAGCGKDDDSSSKNVNVTLSMQSGAMALAEDADAVSDVRLCFKRLRFKTVEEDAKAAESEAALTGPDDAADDAKDDADSDNVDFDIGEVVITEEENALGQVSVPEGKYRRIEVDLDKKCNGYSVMLTNANGTFQTDERVKIKFRGEFDVSATENHVALVADTILAALADVADEGEIRAAIHDPSGVVKNKE